MIFVCPKPIQWSDAYQRLQSAWHADGQQGDPPPQLLILSGWAFSSDLDKQQRWQQTIAWAERHSYSHLLPSLTEDDCYCVVSLSTSYRPRSRCGKVFDECQYHPPAERPTDSALDAAMQRLREAWPAVAGPELGAVCCPAEFSGAKARKLIVTISARDARPPWGSWFELGSSSAARGAFTSFRQRINDTIAPHHVDHVDFRFAKPGRQT